MGYGQEGAGQHQMSAPGGRAGHGADVPGAGVASAETGAEVGAAGAEAGAGAAGGIEALGPLALAAL
jgi:hypothetical protein